MPTPLSRLDAILSRELRSRALEKRALRLGARSRQRDYIVERDAQLEAAAERRRRLAAALESEALDAQRFRFFFSRRQGGLDAARREIDAQILEES